MSQRNISQPENPEDLYRREPFDYRRWRSFYELLGGLIAVSLLVGIGILIFATDAPNYWQNIYVTIIGAALTVFVLDRGAEQRAIRQRKEELILQMGSPANEFAIEAARLLRVKGWLSDRSLEAVHLDYANLQNAYLRDATLAGAYIAEANLEGTHLTTANLSHVNFWKSNLRRAKLIGANMEWAYLRAAKLDNADLRGANLMCAKLDEADFQYAWLIGSVLENAKMSATDLRGAVLVNANMLDADLDGAVFSEETVLPDGTYWTATTDMTRFTDSSHPDFQKHYDWNSVMAWTVREKDN